MNCRQYFFAGIIVSVSGLSALAAAETISGCGPMNGMTPICAVKGSEDLEVLPDGKRILVSQSHMELDPAGAMAWLPGSIAVIDPATPKTHVLYPRQRSRPARADWGDANCPGEIGAALSPHGMHLSRRKDGGWQLLVVNHGGRESVEIFQVVGRGRALALHWRGCAIPPANSIINDAAALPGGGLVVSNMAYNDGPHTMMTTMEKAEGGENTGNILRWLPGAGFDIVPGSESPAPNGVQVDPAGAYLYVAVSGSRGAVRKLDLKRAQWVGAAPVANPDNISWGRDGRLLVAGVRSMADMAPCIAAGFKETCGAAFHIVAVDPATMAAETLIRHGGAPMGFASVAVQAGDAIYVGSPVGDRILQVPLHATTDRP